MKVAALFAREQLHAPVTLALLATLPALFVVAAASVLGEFAAALGGSLAGAAAAAALGAGWSAAFIAGSLAFFETASARAADRRLALAGLGARRVALARMGSSVALAVAAAAAALGALALKSGLAHPWHEAAGVVSFALVYVGVGALVGALVTDLLEGSLAVAFVFLLDVFSGPAMAGGGGSFYSVSREPAALLTAAAAGDASSAAAWLSAAGSALAALAAAFAVFALSARSRL